MKTGDVIRVRKFRHAFSHDPSEWVEYDAGKGHVFTLLVLGREDIKADPGIDANEVLKAMGWKSPKEVEDA